MLKDFSEKSRQNLLNLVSQVENEKFTNFTDWVGDQWYNFQEWMGNLSIEKYLDNINNYYKIIIDKNNVSRNKINTIFENVHNVDDSYKNQFADVNRVLASLKNEIVDLNGSINPNYPDILSEGFDFTRAFLENRNPITDAVATGLVSDWMKQLFAIIGIGDDLQEEAMKKSYEDLLKKVINNETDEQKIVENLKALKKSLTPKEEKNAKKIIELFLTTGEKCSLEEAAEILDMDVSEITESDFLKWVCGEQNAQLFSWLKEKWETPEKVLLLKEGREASDFVLDFYETIYADYSENIIYLESISKALVAQGAEESLANKVAQDMIEDYSEKYSTFVEDQIEKLINKEGKKGLKEVLKLISSDAAFLVDFTLEAKNIIFDIMGLSDTTENISSIYATFQYSDSVMQQYELYRQKINSGVYTEQDLEQCRVYFLLAKDAKIQEYEAILEFANTQDEKEAVKMLTDEIERLKKLKMVSVA